MSKIRSFFVRLYWCKIWKLHDWTSAAQQNIKPTQKQLEAGVEGFYEYAEMYCKRCGHVSEFSKNIIKTMPRELISKLQIRLIAQQRCSELN